MGITLGRLLLNKLKELQQNDDGVMLAMSNVDPDSPRLLFFSSS